MDINIKISFDTNNLRSLMQEFVCLLKADKSTVEHHKCKCHHDDAPKEVRTEVSKPEVTETKKDDSVVCRICGNTFVAGRKNQVYCSIACSKKYSAFIAYRKLHPEATLEQYLQTDHTDVNSRRKFTLKCQCCGKEFNSCKCDTKFCDRTCANIYNAWRRSNGGLTLGQYYERRTGKSRIDEDKDCAQCGKRFTPSLPNQKYCSMECRNIAHEERKQSKANTTPLCAICEMPFTKIDESQRYCANCMSHYGAECEQIELEVKQQKKAEEVANKTKFRVCPRCGRNFEAKNGNEFFCPKCTSRALNVPKIKPSDNDNPTT